MLSSRVSRSILAFCLVAGGAVAAQVGTSQREARAAAGTITGTIYQDFNSDGTNDTVVAFGQATDIGLAGITVRAFDSSGALVGETTSGSDGTYSLAVTGSATNAVRVEFSLPASGPLAAMKPSFAGAQNGTTIRFVDVGATAVDMGFNVPGEYCQNQPKIGVIRQCNVDDSLPGDNDILNSPTIFVADYNGGPYNNSNVPTSGVTSWTDNGAAKESETGSLLGLAYDKRPAVKKFYASAYVRRHARMYESPSGTPLPGALFAVDTTSKTTAFLVDLESLPCTTAAGASCATTEQFSELDAPTDGTNEGFTGYVPSNVDREVDVPGPVLNDVTDSAADADILAGKGGVYEEVGKTGIGDIDADDDGNLYVVSLYTNRLYKVAMPVDGSAPTGIVDLGDVTTPVTCTGGVGRAFAVEIWRGDIYLGVVCDGSTDFATSELKDDNLTANIVRYSPTGGTMSLFIGGVSLGSAGSVETKGDVAKPQGPYQQWQQWNPWTDTFTTAWHYSGKMIRPVPMLSDIEFDRDGSIILGFRDRSADQLSPQGGKENPDGTNSAQSYSSGDLRRLCRTGAGYTSSDYTFENGTTCPYGTAGTNETAGITTDDEFYGGDRYNTGDHLEISAGMTEQVPGFPELLATVFDPWNADEGSSVANGGYSSNTYGSGGVKYLLNSTGESQGAVNAGGGVMFHTRDQSGSSAGGILKSNGMADIEAACDQAPLQIGNRVWIDTDKDGIQDPGETPVVGATVRLYDAGGTLVGTAITDAQGEYYFASNVSEAAGGDGNNVGGGLTVGAAFTIKLDNPADYAAGGPLSGYLLTSTDSTSSATTDTDNSIDNDSSLTGGSTYGVDKFPSISVAAHAPGDNDHTFDFGFVSSIPDAPGPTSTTPVGMGNYTWIDTDKDGLQDADEAPLAGVVVTLYNPDGTPARNLAGGAATATTDAKGYYFIDNLAPGSYYAKFTLPANYAFTAKGDGSSPLDSNPDTTTGITPVFTIAGSASGDTVADTDSSTLAQFVNPTIDAGVIFNGPKVSVGDYVWWDIDRDGIQDKGETPIAGVTLSITTADGSPVTDVFGRPVTTTVTDANGKYSFDNLPLGQYKVTVTPPAGATATKATVGKDVAKDSSTGSATSRNMTTDGDRDPTLDFGFYKPSVSLGNRVWRDRNGDGIQGPEDVGLGGFKLTVRTIDGKPVRDVYGRPVRSIRTKSDGSYSFDNLPPGQYQVEIAYPLGYLPTTANRADRGRNSSTLYAKTKVLAGGQSDVTLDFGVVSRPGQRFRLLPATL